MVEGGEGVKRQVSEWAWGELSETAPWSDDWATREGNDCQAYRVLPKAGKGGGP